eukprot:scaffold24744_cov103-Isochrysis_galbana.AAC.5
MSEDEPDPEVSLAAGRADGWAGTRTGGGGLIVFGDETRHASGDPGACGRAIPRWRLTPLMGGTEAPGGAVRRGWGAARAGWCGGWLRSPGFACRCVLASRPKTSVWSGICCASACIARSTGSDASPFVSPWNEPSRYLVGASPGALKSAGPAATASTETARRSPGATGALAVGQSASARSLSSRTLPGSNATRDRSTRLFWSDFEQSLGATTK